MLESRLANQREIGALGEAVAYRYEYLRLHSLNCANPDAHITDHTKENIGVGYDLESYFNGEKRYIEVKSSVVNNESFFLSENERETLDKLGMEAYVYLVKVNKADSKESKVVREIRNPINHPGLSLDPVAYSASFTNED